MGKKSIKEGIYVIYIAVSLCHAVENQYNIVKQPYFNNKFFKFNFYFFNSKSILCQGIVN